MVEMCQVAEIVLNHVIYCILQTVAEQTLQM